MDGDRCLPGASDQEDRSLPGSHLFRSQDRTDEEERHENNPDGKRGPGGDCEIGRSLA